VTTIRIIEDIGSFAEDKDAARQLRLTRIEPALAAGEEVTIDFKYVELTTQSFVHALISSVVRVQGGDVLQRMIFANCNEGVRRLIEIVVEYSQDVTTQDDLLADGVVPPPDANSAGNPDRDEGHE
jgi:hypothetical protein